MRHSAGAALALSLLVGCNDRTEAPHEIRRVVDGGPWTAFGAIAAEIELARWD